LGAKQYTPFAASNLDQVALNDAVIGLLVSGFDVFLLGRRTARGHQEHQHHQEPRPVSCHVTHRAKLSTRLSASTKLIVF
jgi:hypothetical protein